MRETYKEEAQELLQKVQEKNANGKSISLVLELAVGKVEDMIQRMVFLCTGMKYQLWLTPMPRSKSILLSLSL